MSAASRFFLGLPTRILAWCTLAAMSPPLLASVTVALTAPANGSIHAPAANITLSASATANNGYTVSKVEFFRGATLVATDTSAPYSVVWANVPQGNYTLTAKVTAVKKNNPNQTAISSPRDITVTTTPAVAITSPANGIYVGYPGNVTVTANASDADGTIAKVDFVASADAGGFPLESRLTATQPPYTVAFDNLAPTYQWAIQAIATDNQGAYSSAGVFVLSTWKPNINFDSPSQGSVFTAPASMQLTATATDLDGTVATVEFYHGTTLIAAVTTAPYTFGWNNVPQGAYTLTAKAIDNHGISTISGPVNVVVNGGLAQLHYVHVDHLNTPRLIANQTGQAVWRWDQQEPFGVSPPDKNPSGLGTFDFPLRFAGQYDDAETGLFYNYFRDCYDPVLGRYCQSDPVGLDGGINTYVYASLNPLSLIDPDGLLGRAPGTFGTGGSTYQTQGNVWGGFTQQNGACDFPMINLNPCVTNCCKEHDDCFNRYKCNWSSWFGNMFGTTFKCQGCNTAARQCIVNAISQCNIRPCIPPSPQYMAP